MALNQKLSLDSVRKLVVTGLALALALSVSSCKETGFQGGDLREAFKGILKVQNLSPTAIKLEWNKEPRYGLFKIYRKGINAPIKEETFSSTIIRDLRASTSYEFAVTAVDNDTKAEVGLEHFQPVTMWPNFTGIGPASLSARSPTSIMVLWSMIDASVNYKIYVKEEGGSWNFNSPAATQKGSASALVSGLKGGTNYCFYMVAEYADNTSEPSTSDLSVVNRDAPCLTTAATLTNLPIVTVGRVSPGKFAWFSVDGGDPSLLGVSGAQYEYRTSIYDTDADLEVASVRGASGVQVRSFVAMDAGRKRFHAIIKKVNASGTVLDQARVQVMVTGGGGSPWAIIRQVKPANPNGPQFPALQSAGKGIQELGSAVVSGDFNCDGLPDLAVGAPRATPYIDPLHYDEMGAVVIYYSFIPPPCSAEYGTECGSTPDARLITSPEPSTTAQFPKPTLVYYPAPLGQGRSNQHFGQRLAVGNVNNDCQAPAFNPNTPGVDTTIVGNCDTLAGMPFTQAKGFVYDMPPAGPDANDITVMPPVGISTRLNRLFACQDLAITTNELHSSSPSTSAVYVLFGSTQGLVTGSGAVNYGVDEATCNPSSNTCPPVQITAPPAAHQFGTSIAFGDFNNDGFDDLAIGMERDDKARDVAVIRGSALGLISRTAPEAFPSLTTVSTVTLPNAENRQSIFKNSSGGDNSVNIQDGLFLDPPDFLAGTEKFGFSVAAVRYSRECVPNSKDPATKYRMTAPVGTDYPNHGVELGKCSDLVIGVPGRSLNRGSIITCKGQVELTTAPDPAHIKGWDCAEHWPDDALANDQYGYSLLGVDNQGFYPLTESQIRGPDRPSVTSALYVGAPYASPLGIAGAGKVYGYYVTPHSAQNALGGIQGVLNTNNTGLSGPVVNPHPVEAVNSIACDARNTNRPNDGSAYGGWNANTVRHCKHQAIFNTPGQAGQHFGMTMGSLTDVQQIQDRLRIRPALAVGAPDRDVLDSTGTRSIVDAGAVFVYRPDSSTFGLDEPPDLTQIGETRYTNNLDTSCNQAADCIWYSGGISPFGPTLIYPLDLDPGSHFGLGGIAGGNFDGNPSWGPTGDIVIGAPGSNHAAAGNGDVFMFFSQSQLPSSMNDFGIRLENNISKELNYHFEKAKVVGDLNGDGYDDMVTQIQTGSRVQLVVYYGSATGLVTSPAPSPNPVLGGPLVLNVPSDPQIGYRYYRVSDVKRDGFSVNGDAYDDLLLMGSNASYFYYGSFAGLVAGTQPEVSPVGTNPLKFGRCCGPMGDGWIELHKNMPSMSGNVVDASNQAVGYGDFNGDGFTDIAVGQRTDWYSMPQNSIPLTTNYDSGNIGRIVVIYGGAEGLQINKGTGLITYKKAGAPATNGDVADPGGNACALPTGSPARAVCKVQILAAPYSPTGTSPQLTGSNFGYSLSGLPPIDEPEGNTFHGLVIGDPETDGGDGRVYFYKGSLVGLSHLPAQQLIAHPTYKSGAHFGNDVAFVGDVNKDTRPDIAITAPGNGFGHAYLFYTTLANGGTVYGASLPTTTDYWTNGPAILLNKMNDPATPAAPRPQVFTMASLVGGESFGRGLSSAGDFNGDGYDDVVVNAASGTYNIDATVTATGFAVVWFGSINGLQTDAPVSPTPKCYGGSQPLCEPYQIFLPGHDPSTWAFFDNQDPRVLSYKLSDTGGREPYEYTYVSTHAAGDINGDGIKDLVIGGMGRTHPSGLAFSVGVFYVLY